MKNINWKWLLFSFNGRANRAKVWAVFLITLVISAPLVITRMHYLDLRGELSEIRATSAQCKQVTPEERVACVKEKVSIIKTEHHARIPMGLNTVYWAWAILELWIGLAVYTKRLHDRNLSGWWQAVPVTIIVGLTVVLQLVGTSLPHPAIIAGIALGIIADLGLLVLFVICGFLKGTAGPNKFGPDPLSHG